MASERRPDDGEYYESRLELFSQGDIFRDVPLAYPLPADEIVEEEGHGSRRFLSGPFEVGLAMLVTPTCSMRAQGAPDRYAHPVRTLVPLRPSRSWWRRDSSTTRRPGSLASATG